MQQPYSIVITTFEQRFEPHLIPLIDSIKTIRPQAEIIVMVNGPSKGDFNDNFRCKLLQFLANHTDCYPNIFPKFQALAKLWNRGALNATNDRILILNDDLAINTLESPNFFDHLEITLNREHHAFKINGSFSHFVVSKRELIKVGFFDERLLGIGEEDGDFVWRYHETYGREIPSIDVPGIYNIQSKIADEGFTKGIGHYSQFNRDFIKHQKYQETLIGGFKGMFDKRSKKKISDEKQYPYESFYLDNIHKL